MDDFSGRFYNLYLDNLRQIALKWAVGIEGIGDIVDIGEEGLCLRLSPLSPSLSPSLLPQLQLCYNHPTFSPLTQLTPLTLNFSALWRRWQREKWSGAADPFWRALGAAGRPGQMLKKMRVLDATAGFGKDSLRLLFYGCEVYACERLPEVGCLLEDAFWRYHFDAQIQLPIQLLKGDAQDFLARPNLDVDVIYLDPMYPNRAKYKAAAKKEMQILQHVINSERDDELQVLLQLAVNVAKKRVVIKRPLWVKPLSLRTLRTITCHSCLGKSIRYDVYCITSSTISSPQGDNQL
ncbi:MAG: class I SAM-dependent methyltransferase [Oligoflexia bacterium]|nr:class I SAM-dependent methyltransferase [Oligoflexia bacterium]